jgi:hypothetical protein
MSRAFRWAVALTLLAVAPAWSAAKYTIQTAKAEPPKALKEPIRKLLGNQAVKLLDPKGKVICQLWFRKEVPAEASDEQIKNGLTYRELKETTLMAAVKFDKAWPDYRKQTIRAGVYTLRLGFQPQDGDHMGVSTYPDFCLLVAAGKDTKPGPMDDPKTLQTLSIKSIGTTHPGVLMLFPYEKPKGGPKLVSKENNHWVLDVALPVKVKGKKTFLGVGLTVVGASE